jgi:hypothetical protein
MASSRPNPNGARQNPMKNLSKTKELGMRVSATLTASSCNKMTEFIDMHRHRRILCPKHNKTGKNGNIGFGAIAISKSESGVLLLHVYRSQK